MKNKIIYIAAISFSCALFVSGTKSEDQHPLPKVEINPQLKQELEKAPRIFTPPTNPGIPYCPAVGDTRYIAQAESQDLNTLTEHCTKCGIGALFAKGDGKACSYCEAVF